MHVLYVCMYVYAACACVCSYSESIHIADAGAVMYTDDEPPEPSHVESSYNQGSNKSISGVSMSMKMFSGLINPPHYIHRRTPVSSNPTHQHPLPEVHVRKPAGLIDILTPLCECYDLQIPSGLLQMAAKQQQQQPSNPFPAGNSPNHLTTISNQNIPFSFYLNQQRQGGASGPGGESGHVLPRLGSSVSSVTSGSRGTYIHTGV